MCAARMPVMLLAGGLKRPVGKLRWSSSVMARTLPSLVPGKLAGMKPGYAARPRRWCCFGAGVRFRRDGDDDGGRDGDDGAPRQRTPGRQTPSTTGQRQESSSWDECSTGTALDGRRRPAPNKVGQPAAGGGGEGYYPGQRGMPRRKTVILSGVEGPAV